MTPAGFEKLPDLDEEFTIDEDILDALKSDDQVWTNFSNFPDLYKRIKISKIQNARKNKEEFKKLLDTLIKNSKAGRMSANWNDYGRLQKYNSTYLVYFIPFWIAWFFES